MGTHRCEQGLPYQRKEEPDEVRVDPRLRRRRSAGAEAWRAVEKLEREGGRSAGRQEEKEQAGAEDPGAGLGERAGQVQVSAIRTGTGQRARQGAPRPAEIPSPGAALSVRSRSDGGQWMGGASGRGQESRGFGAVLLPGDGGRQRGVGPEMDMLPRSSALV